jgi:Fe2+ or Zn2+ uptake regulation protein
MKKAPKPQKSKSKPPKVKYDWLEDFKQECKKRGFEYEDARKKVLKKLDQIPDSSKFAFTPSEVLDLLKPH